MNDFDGEYARKELATPLGVKPEAVKVQAYAPGYHDSREGKSHHVTVPVHIYRNMLAAIPQEGRPKPLPETFKGDPVVAAVRVKFAGTGVKKHAAVIICQYEDQYAHADLRTRYSVHWIGADKVSDPWDGWSGAYDLTSFDAAYNELTRRLEREHVISSF
jgi:hypothetical protein